MQKILPIGRNYPLMGVSLFFNFSPEKAMFFYDSLSSIKIPKNKSENKKIKLKFNQQLFVKQHSKSIVTTIDNDFCPDTLNDLAKKTGFVLPCRKLTGVSFLNTLMFSCYAQVNTSLPDHTEDLQKHFGITMSKEALLKKFTPKAVDFMKEVIKLKINKQVHLAENDSLRTHFSEVNVKNSSKYALPTTYDDQYPSFGNFSKSKGMMNIQYEYDLISGNWKSLELTTIRKNDQQNSKETIADLVKEGLYIRNLR